MNKLFYLLLFIFIYSSPARANSNVEKDRYELDDYKELATLIDVGDTINQQHNFHQYGDQDWYQFYAQSSLENPIPYSIEVKNPQARADAKLEVFDSNGQLLFGGAFDDGIAGEEELFEAKFPSSGIYYLRITQYDPSIYGENTNYEIRLYHAVMRFEGKIITRVLDAINGQPIPSPTVASSSPDRSLYYGSRNGAIGMSHPASSNFSLTFSAEKYQSKTISNLSLEETERKRIDFVELQPLSNNAVAKVTSNNLIPTSSPPISLPTPSQSPDLVQVLSEQQALTLPRIFIQGQGINPSTNLKAIFSLVDMSQSQGKILFDVSELYLLDDIQYDPQYPSFILQTTLLYIPLLMLGETSFTNVVFKYIEAKPLIRFELIDYKN